MWYIRVCILLVGALALLPHNARPTLAVTPMGVAAKPTGVLPIATDLPTPEPTTTVKTPEPTAQPSAEPTISATEKPTDAPTAAATHEPIATTGPPAQPSVAPTQPAIETTAPISGTGTAPTNTPLPTSDAPITATGDVTPTGTTQPTTTLEPTPGVCDPDPERDLSAKAVERGAVRFRNRSVVCSYPIGVAIYIIPSGDPDDKDIDSQIWFADSEKDGAPVEIGPATDARTPAEMTIELETPLCDAIQQDAFVGQALKSLQGQRYGERLLDAQRYAAEATDCAPLTGEVVFEQSAITVCEMSPETIALAGSVALQPTDGRAQLEVVWETTAPDQQMSAMAVERMPVKDGDQFEIAIPWPGVPQGAEVVEVAVVGRLYDESGAKQLDGAHSQSTLYWDAQLVCDVPIKPAPATPAPTDVPIVQPTVEIATPDAVLMQTILRPKKEQEADRATEVPTVEPPTAVPPTARPDLLYVAYQPAVVPVRLPETGQPAGPNRLLILGGIALLLAGTFIRRVRK
jgi:hypothetical protein